MQSFIAAPRTRRQRAVVAGTILLWTAGLARSEPAAKVTLVKAGRLLDVRTGKYLTDQALLIEGERIKEVGPAAALASRAPREAATLELAGLSVLPGLVDCHSHLLCAMRPVIGNADNLLLTVAGLSPSSRALLGAANAREALEAGITTVRNVGHSGVDGDIALRDAVNEGWVPGPRIQAAGRKITPPGGQVAHPRPELVQPVIDLEFLPVNGPLEARRAVRELLFAGADVVKVVMDDGPRLLALDEIKAVVEEAHRSKVKVAAHAETAEGIRLAVEAGVDSVEHANAAGDETLRAMAAKGIALGATDWPLSMLRDVFLESRKVDAAERAAFEAQAQAWLKPTRERMDRARKAGVHFVMASDMWFRYPGLGRGQASLRVLEGLQDEGVPPAEILRAATLGGAELLGWADRIGSLEAGKLADLLAVDGDPLQDVRELQKARFVMKGGVVVRDDRPRR
jgi:imidazolonepropionase-like amidohydrolase